MNRRSGLRAGRLPRATLALLAIVVSGVGGGARGATDPAAKAPIPWLEETPDAMIARAADHALDAAAAAQERLAALVVIAALAPRASETAARVALERIAAGATTSAAIRTEAALVARELAPDRGTELGARADARLGVVRDLAVLGPFRDTGGGLALRDGPEAGGRPFIDPAARYSWGTYEVAWRNVPTAFATAAGVPLDLFLFPRNESCSWVATALHVGAPQKIDVWLAASGEARLTFDEVDVARDDAVHASALFDRLAARVNVDAGDHLLAAKICSGALDDDGRVRFRVTNERGTWPDTVTASADLGHARLNKKKLLFEPIVPPLADVLRRPAAKPDEQLEAAVVRSLGGADDLRSPRAPGVLAALADGGRLSAAQLALAAWVATSGANRSMWLNRARSDSSLPRSARAFVERRLVERRLEAGFPDWAMATAAAAELEQSSDAEAALLQSRVELGLGGDAFRLRALRRLETVASRTADAPDAVLEKLADVAAAYDASLSAKAWKRLAERGAIGASQVASLVPLGGAAIVDAARRAFDGGVDDADEALAVADVVAKAGKHAAARELYAQLARWSPNRATVWAGLAHETSAMTGDPTRDEAIAAALRRARDLEPGESRYRAELSLRSHSTADEELHADERALTPIGVILGRRPASVLPDPAAPSVPDVASHELHWSRAVTMHADGRVSELVHYAREIVIAPRTEEELYEDIPAEGDLTEIVRARVYRKGGATAFAVEQSSDGGHPRIRWPELSRGDVIEVAFRSWTAGPVGGRADPPFYRLDYAGSLSTRPLAYNEVSVASPVDRPIYVDVVNGKADRTEVTTLGDQRVVRLVWDKPRNVPDEPLAPPLSEIVSTVVLSTFRDWAAFRGWYSEAVRGFTEPDAQVRDLAARLTQRFAAREDKLKAIFDFVADDIRYVNYVSGEWWLPNRPQQVVARREGDCDDKALLLITLLSAVGIDAQEVLVQTRLTGEPSILRAKGAAIPLFDHGIAFLSGPDGGRYLDATSPQSRMGPLPSMDARAVALRMDGPPEIVDLPSSSPEGHGIDARWTLSLQSDGSAGLEGDERASGDDAFVMRSYLTEPGARSSWIEQRLTSTWFQTVEVDKKVDFQGDLAAGSATVRWRARSTALARHEGDELVVPLSPSQTLSSQLAPLVRRTLPVRLPPHLAPRKEAHTIRLVAPQGWTFEPLPLGGDVDGGPFGRAHLDVSRDPRDPRAVIVHRLWVCDQSAIDVNEYPKWRSWIQRVDALMHETVRLAPVPASGK